MFFSFLKKLQLSISVSGFAFRTPFISLCGTSRLVACTLGLSQHCSLWTRSPQCCLPNPQLLSSDLFVGFSLSGVVYSTLMAIQPNISFTYLFWSSLSFPS